MLLSVALVQDINAQVEYPGDITAFGEKAVFVVRDQPGEFALMATDGTAGGTTQISSGTDTLAPAFRASLADVDGTLYYSTSLKPSLYESDGTLAGTVSVGLPADTGLRSLGDLTAVGGRLFFTGVDDGGFGLYASDGTTAGTRLVRDFGASVGSSSTFGLTDVGGVAYFAADDGIHGEQLWRSDRTSAGTTMVTDLSPGSDPSDLTASGGTLYFLASQAPGGTSGAVYRTDGTGPGTISAPDVEADGPLSPFDGSVAFDGTTTSGHGLVLSDGTAAGTALVRADYLAGASFDDLTASGRSLYFTTQDASGTTQLGETDGSTTALITPVQRAPIDPPDGPPQPPVADGSGGIFFDAYDPDHGVELWHSDGTSGGTGIVLDLDPGPVGADPTDLTEFRGSLLFAAQDGDGSSQLWSSDGTAGGTRLVAADSPGSTLGSIPGPTATSGPTTAAIGPTGYFVADNPDLGTELWKSDGTTAGTVVVADLDPGPAGSDPTDLTPFGGLIYFVADDGTLGRQVWKTDGTEAGTVVVSDVPSSGATASGPTDLTVFDGLLYFSDQGDGGGGGVGLYRTDGTGSVLVAVTTAAPGLLTVVGAGLDFFVSGPTAGEVLWSSDGTTAGTSPVAVLDANPGESTVPEATAVGSNLFFVLQTSAAANALWVSDGTALGTTRVATFEPENASAAPNDLTAFDSKLYFVAGDGQDGNQLWESDGTAGGTSVVAVIGPAPSPYVSGVGDLTVFEDSLYFLGAAGFGEANVYKSDGTSIGTELVGPFDSLGPLTPLDGSLDFVGVSTASSATAQHSGLFQTDGTPAGTVMLGDVDGTYFGSPVTILAQPDAAHILLVSSDLFHGEEPGLVSDDPPSIRFDPSASPIAIVARPNLIDTFGSDPDYGQSLTYSLDPGAPAGTVIDPRTGVITFTPTADQIGAQDITARVTDDALDGESAMATLTIYVTDGVPVLAPIADRSAAPGQAVVVQASATELDPGATTIYRLGPDDLPGGASIDPTTGVFTYTVPASAITGSYLVQVTASDSMAPEVSSTTSFVLTIRPPAPVDLDADGESDLAIYDVTSASFYARYSGTNNSEALDDGNPTFMGNPAHVNVPIAADFDGDGRVDEAIYDETTAAFYIRDSGTNFATAYFNGAPAFMGNPAHVNIPIVGDFDGDGKADLAIYDETVGAFYIRYSSTDYATTFNGADPTYMGDPSHVDVPLVADLDGDGKADLLLYDETAAAFYGRDDGLRGELNGGNPIFMGDPSHVNIPIAADFDGDRLTDLAIYDETAAAFYVRYSGGDYLTAMADGAPIAMGNPSHANVPLVADFDGDGKADLAICDETAAAFYSRDSSTDYATSMNGGAPSFMGDPSHVIVPLEADPFSVYLAEAAPRPGSSPEIPGSARLVATPFESDSAASAIPQLSSGLSPFAPAPSATDDGGSSWPLGATRRRFLDAFSTRKAGIFE